MHVKVQEEEKNKEKIKNQWEDQVGAELRSIRQQEVSFAGGRLRWNRSEICSLAYNHSRQQRSFCVCFFRYK